MSDLTAWLAVGDPMATYHLRDLSGSLPLSRWREITWDLGCEFCGYRRYASAGGDERVRDGDSAVCVDCGLTAMWSADGESAAHAQDAHAVLAPAALAGLRRVLGIRPYWPEAPDAP